MTPKPVEKLTPPQLAMLEKLARERPPEEGLKGNRRWFGMAVTLRMLRQRGYLHASNDAVTAEGLRVLEVHRLAERCNELLSTT